MTYESVSYLMPISWWVHVNLSWLMSQWVSDGYLMPISWRENVNFQWDDDEVHFVLDQHAELDFYSAISLKQQSRNRHAAPLWHIILIQS